MRASGVRLGFLGPEGSFSHEAALRWKRQRVAVRDRPVELVGLDSIDRLFEAASAAELDAIVCPLENALEGSVVLTMDLWLHASALYQVGEVVVPVHHHLLLRPDTGMEAVRAVLSHPHALAQCRRTLAGLLPAAELRPVASTAEAARRVAQSLEPWAAVAGLGAARLYRLAVAWRDVQDATPNATRFGVFGWEVPGPTGSDRTTVLIGSLDDRPGLLRDLLSEFADRGINLTRIESRPSREGLGRYLFLIDLEGHIREPRVQQALRGVRGKVGYLRFMGSYARASYEIEGNGADGDT